MAIVGSLVAKRVASPHHLVFVVNLWSGNSMTMMYSDVCLMFAGQVLRATTVHSATLSRTTELTDSVVRMFTADVREQSECVTALLRYQSALLTIPSSFDLACAAPDFTLTIIAGLLLLLNHY